MGNGFLLFPVLCSKKEVTFEAAPALGALQRPERAFWSRERALAGRMQEVEYRILMWTMSPEQRKRALAREKGLEPQTGCISLGDTF